MLITVGGHLHLLQYASHEGCNFEASVTAAAAKHGHFELLKWLASQKCASWDERTCTFLAVGGHLEVLTIILLWPFLIFLLLVFFLWLLLHFFFCLLYLLCFL